MPGFVYSSDLQAGAWAGQPYLLEFCGVRPRRSIEKVTKAIKSCVWPFALASKDVSYFLSQLSRSPKGQDFHLRWTCPVWHWGHLEEQLFGFGGQLGHFSCSDTFLGLFEFPLTAAQRGQGVPQDTISFCCPHWGAWQPR